MRNTGEDREGKSEQEKDTRKMAEAVPEQPLMSPFFCHKCCVEIDTLLPDYTCPECKCGFIEEVAHEKNDSESETDSNNIGLGLPDIEIRQSTSNITLEVHDIIANDAVDDPMVDPNPSVGRQQRSANNAGIYASRRIPFLSLIRRIDRRARNGGMPRQPLDLDRDRDLEYLIHDLLNVTRPPRPAAISREDQPPVMILGNPGDYIWGRDGWDAVVTQLLTQIDSVGPPPLPQTQIDELPTITVTQVEVDCKLQCCICWEDFKLDESVKQLPCQHIYHVPCIVRWLELHGTCPICRQTLGDQNSVQANQDTAGPTFAALFSAANATTGISLSSTSAENSSTDNSWSDF